MHTYAPKRNTKLSHETILFNVGLQPQSDFKYLGIIMTSLSQSCCCWVDAAILKLSCYNEIMCSMVLSNTNRAAKISLKQSQFPLWKLHQLSILWSADMRPGLINRVQFEVLLINSFMVCFVVMNFVIGWCQVSPRWKRCVNGDNFSIQFYEEFVVTCLQHCILKDFSLLSLKFKVSLMTSPCCLSVRPSVWVFH
jgi:hypothetical protein